MSRSTFLILSMICRALAVCYMLAVAMLVLALGWRLLHQHLHDASINPGQAIALNLGGIALLLLCPFTWLAEYFERKADKAL